MDGGGSVRTQGSTPISARNERRSSPVSNLRPSAGKTGSGAF